MKERVKEIALYFIEHKVATIEELMAYEKVTEYIKYRDIQKCRYINLIF